MTDSKPPYLKYCPRCKHYQTESTVCRRFSFNVGDYPAQFIKSCGGEAFIQDDTKVAEQREQSANTSDIPEREDALARERERDQEMLDPRSIARRAAMAVSLMIGFYLLAFVLIAGLLFATWAQVVLADRVYVRFVILCLMGAVTIAWAILPRFDRFSPPGPRLTNESEPLLFKRLEDIARKAEQEMPREVYLLPELNAWVANRGGVMGFGSRRVMGIGWPLLAMVNTDEFDAIIAHEFGHYHGGDTRLGPWVYKTHAAIGRTLANLGDDSILSLPFRSYGAFFLRTTMSISRNQEYTADLLASEIVGAGALISGLTKIHAQGFPYEFFWHQEVRPLVSGGFAPPLMEGYYSFIEKPSVQEVIEERKRQEQEQPDAGLYDSHPPLADRIAALEDMAESSDTNPTSGKAIDLLSDAESTEQNLFAFLAEAVEVENLRRISWDEVLTEAYLPRWRQQAMRAAEMLGSDSIASLPELLANRGREIAFEIVQPEQGFPDEYLLRMLYPYLGSSIVMALIESGWEVKAELGDSVSLSKGNLVMHPFKLSADLTAQRISGEVWRGLMSKLQIGDLPLVSQSVRELTKEFDDEEE